MLDYTDGELEAVERVLTERYRNPIDIHLADCEVQLDMEKDERVERPAIFWNALDCNFVLIKMGEDEFRGFFFYQPDEQFSGAQQTYTNVVNCVTALLQSQADQFGQSQGYVPGATAADLD